MPPASAGPYAIFYSLRGAARRRRAPGPQARPRPRAPRRRAAAAGDDHLHPRGQAGDGAVSPRPGVGGAEPPQNPMSDRPRLVLPHRALAGAGLLRRGRRGRGGEPGGRRANVAEHRLFALSTAAICPGEVAIDVLGAGGGGGAAWPSRRRRAASPRAVARRRRASSQLALLEEAVGVLERRGRLAPLHAAADHRIEIGRLAALGTTSSAELAAAAPVAAAHQIAVGRARRWPPATAPSRSRGTRTLRSTVFTSVPAKVPSGHEHLVAGAAEAAVEDPIELDAGRELDGDLGVAGHGAGEALRPPPRRRGRGRCRPRRSSAARSSPGRWPAMIFSLYSTSTPMVVTLTPRPCARWAMLRKPGTSRTPWLASPSLSRMIRFTLPRVCARSRIPSSIPHEMQVSPPRPMPRMAALIRSRAPGLDGGRGRPRPGSGCRR